MTLSEYFALERGNQARLAEKTGIQAVLLSQWATGVRQVPIDRCAALEKATDGQVTRQVLRPDDWESIWPELTGERKNGNRRAA